MRRLRVSHLVKKNTQLLAAVLGPQSPPEQQGHTPATMPCPAQHYPTASRDVPPLQGTAATSQTPPPLPSVLEAPPATTGSTTTTTTEAQEPPAPLDAPPLNFTSLLQQQFISSLEDGDAFEVEDDVVKGLHEAEKGSSVDEGSNLENTTTAGIDYNTVPAECVTFSSTSFALRDDVSTSTLLGTGGESFVPGQEVGWRGPQPSTTRHPEDNDHHLVAEEDDEDDYIPLNNTSSEREPPSSEDGAKECDVQGEELAGSTPPIFDVDVLLRSDDNSNTAAGDMAPTELKAIHASMANLPLHLRTLSHEEVAHLVALFAEAQQVVSNASRRSASTSTNDQQSSPVIAALFTPNTWHAHNNGESVHVKHDDADKTTDEDTTHIHHCQPYFIDTEPYHDARQATVVEVHLRSASFGHFIMSRVRKNEDQLQHQEEEQQHAFVKFTRQLLSIGDVVGAQAIGHLLLRCHNVFVAPPTASEKDDDNDEVKKDVPSPTATASISEALRCFSIGELIELLRLGGLPTNPFRQAPPTTSNSSQHHSVRLAIIPALMLRHNELIQYFQRWKDGKNVVAEKDACVVDLLDAVAGVFTTDASTAFFAARHAYQVHHLDHSDVRAKFHSGLQRLLGFLVPLLVRQLISKKGVPSGAIKLLSQQHEQRLRINSIVFASSVLLRLHCFKSVEVVLLQQLLKQQQQQQQPQRTPRSDNETPHTAATSCLLDELDAHQWETICTNAVMPPAQDFFTMCNSSSSSSSASSENCSNNSDDDLDTIPTNKDGHALIFTNRLLVVKLIQKGMDLLSSLSLVGSFTLLRMVLEAEKRNFSPPVSYSRLLTDVELNVADLVGNPKYNTSGINFAGDRDNHFGSTEDLWRVVAILGFAPRSFRQLFRRRHKTAAIVGAFSSTPEDAATATTNSAAQQQQKKNIFLEGFTNQVAMTPTSQKFQRLMQSLVEKLLLHGHNSGGIIHGRPTQHSMGQLRLIEILCDCPPALYSTRVAEKIILVAETISTMNIMAIQATKSLKASGLDPTAFKALSADIVATRFALGSSPPPSITGAVAAKGSANVVVDDGAALTDAVTEVDVACIYLRFMLSSFLAKKLVTTTGSGITSRTNAATFSNKRLGSSSVAGGNTNNTQALDNLFNLLAHHKDVLPLHAIILCLKAMLTFKHLHRTLATGIFDTLNDSSDEFLAAITAQDAMVIASAAAAFGFVESEQRLMKRVLQHCVRLVEAI